MNDRERIAVLTAGQMDASRWLSWGSCGDGELQEGLDVLFGWNVYLAAGKDGMAVPGQIRFDTEPAQPLEFEPTSNSGLAGFVPLRQVAAFTRQAKAAKRVAIRVTYGGETVTEIFDLTGLEDALTALPCGPSVPETTDGRN
jgi:hypothetical protein